VDIHLGDDDVSSSSLWLVEPEELYVEGRQRGTKCTDYTC